MPIQTENLIFTSSAFSFVTKNVNAIHKKMCLIVNVGYKDVFFAAFNLPKKLIKYFYRAIEIVKAKMFNSRLNISGKVRKFLFLLTVFLENSNHRVAYLKNNYLKEKTNPLPR